MDSEVALITGGCGFVGYHVTKALLAEGVFSSIHVFSRTPTQNLLSGVQYHAGSITSNKDIVEVLTSTQPTVIFHVASPSAVGSVNTKSYWEVNVEGTKHLLKAASNISCVKAFVYTSSSTVAQPPHRNVDESKPLSLSGSKYSSNYYSVTKAIADLAVQEANSTEGFRTCCLRLSSVYGERDSQLLPGLIDLISKGKTKYQIGNNAPVDFLSVENATRAHISAYKTLLREFEEHLSGNASGEAFYITDDNPMLFWTFARKVWEVAGHSVQKEDIVVVPRWVVLGLAIFMEWIFLVFTFGRIAPPGELRPFSVRYVSEECTFSTEKAKRDLNYKPIDDRQENIKKGVAWEMRGSVGERGA
ncbi:hypothetical protein BGZ60DRAFT_472907 [Tricladium varicosporioides]|nr:hypothetical protein BGZ60DRAFT_472907 [Hymenoscyphus varicosporioides]